MGERGSSERTKNGNAPRTPPGIPSYEVVRLLGSGAFGEVWYAHHLFGEGGRRPVALKVLSARSAHSVEIGALRTLLSRVSRAHPHLVSIHDVGETESFAYYSMDLADASGERGGLRTPEAYVPHTLAEELRRAGELGFERTTEVALQVLDGLEHLHDSHLLHQDLKPANIVFLRGQAALCDFGLIRSDLEPGPVGGTPLYAPREGVRDPSGDLYCLGKTLFEMVTGAPPSRFPSVPAGVSDAALATLGRLRHVIDRACDPEPDCRFRTCDAFRQALRKAIEEPRPTSRRAARRRRIGARAGLLLAVLAATTLATIWRSGRARPTGPDDVRIRVESVLDSYFEFTVENRGSRSVQLTGARFSGSGEAIEIRTSDKRLPTREEMLLPGRSTREYVGRVRGGYRSGSGYEEGFESITIRFEDPAVDVAPAPPGADRQPPGFETESRLPVDR